MSQRGTEFIERWIQENFHGESPHRREDQRPAEWARECVGAAEQAGISKEEIEEDFGNLEKFLEMAIPEEGEQRSENNLRGPDSDEAPAGSSSTS